MRAAAGVPEPMITPAEAAAGLRWSTTRLAGLGALGFASAVLVSNALLVGAPFGDVTVGEASAWYMANETRVMLSASMVGLAFPALLAFGAMMLELGRSRAGAHRWMLLGAFGAVAMVGVFSLVAAGQITSLLLAPAGGDAFLVAWTLHNGAFAVNMTILGTAFLGFAIGAHAAGLTPGWQRAVGVTGASLLLATGFANTSVTGGSPVALMGFAGFLLWLLWIVTTGIRLVRMPEARAG